MRNHVGDHLTFPQYISVKVNMSSLRLKHFLLFEGMGEKVEKKNPISFFFFFNFFLLIYKEKEEKEGKFLWVPPIFIYFYFPSKSMK